MILYPNEEEDRLEKIFAPYYDYTKEPALSPNAPQEAVEAYEKYLESFAKRYDDAVNWMLETEVYKDKW